MSNEAVWLDALPHEVCVRIAANATQMDLDAVMRIGKVSPILRAAVLQPLNKFYTFNQSRMFSSYVIDRDNARSSDHEHASAPEHTSASHHHSQSPDDSASESASESAAASSDHAQSSPDVSDAEQPLHESGPSASDSQPPHPPNEYPDLIAALQHMLRAGFGDDASNLTIKEAATMEEFWAQCEPDNQPSQHSAEVHSNQDATEQPADDEDAHQSLQSPTGEQSEHESDPVHSENRSEDENEENDSMGVPENRTNEEASQSNENHSSCENDSNAEAETSLPSDAEKPPEQETPFVAESVMKFHREFAEFLGEDTRSMFACALVPELRSQPAFQTCMASPLLEELVLAVPTDVYESFRVGPNLRKLAVMVTEDDLPVIPFLQLLSSTKLRELQVTADSSACLHQYLTRDPETASLLASWFPNVEKLDIDCHGCKTLEDSPAPIWSVIKHFRGLRSINLSEPVPEDAIEELQRMESVSLYGEKLRDLSERIPDRIVDIVTNDEWSKGIVGKWNLCEDQLERLGNYPRLETLNCCIKPGMERELVRIAGNLTSLGLAFDASGTPVGEKLIPLRPKEGAILDLVRAAPNLKFLRLINMRISRSELQEVLISAGDRLEVFAEVVFVNSFMGQFVHQNSSFKFPKSENKQELKLFVAILKTAAVHNPKLTELSIDLRPEWFTDIRAVRSILVKLQAACLVLTRRAISLDYNNLAELFQKFQNGEIGMVHLFQSLHGDLGIPGVAVG